MIVKDSNSNMTVAASSKSNYAPVSSRADINADTMAPHPSSSPPPNYDACQGTFRLGAEPARQRFWRAFAVALVSWFFLSMFVHGIVRLALVHRDHKHGGIAKDYPEFKKGEIITCAGGPDWPVSGSVNGEHKMSTSFPRPPYQSRKSFLLPVDADHLYFLSRGSLASGSVRFELSSDQSSDSVKVDVTASYWSTGALDRASVCSLQRHGSSNYYGVGIFTPRRWRGGSMRDRLQFDVVVHLPPRVYADLQTSYENFSLYVGDLQGMVQFENAHLTTSNSHITATTFEAHKGVLKSSNGAITGKYNVTKSLELITSNARITADVDMHSIDDSHATSLLLRTSNGHIDSILNLNGQPYLSSFAVQSITSNALSQTHVNSHPHSTALTLDMKTSNNRARAAVQPSFEGPFFMRTSNASPMLTAGRDEEVEDPSGEGRARNIQVNRKVGGLMEGKVWWGDWRSRGKGWVHLTSSNGQVELDLSGNPAW